MNPEISMNFLLVFGIGMFLLGLVYLGLFLFSRRAKQLPGDWPQTQGKVKAAYIYRHLRWLPDRADATYTPVVEYAYTVQDVPYTSRRIDFKPYPYTTCDDVEPAQAIIAKYPVGGVVNVHYNPFGPTQAVLEAAKPVGYWRDLTAGLLGIGLGALLIALALLLV